MRTGPTRKQTRETIVALKKQGKKAKNAVLSDIARRLSRATRQRAEVNVFKLNELALKMKGKVFVVPGKVLSKGNVNTKIEVACFSCSKKAEEKIHAHEGKVMDLNELIESGMESKNLVIVE